MEGFNTSLASCGSQWPRALRLMKAMSDFAVIADTISINSSMSACASAGTWQSALDLQVGAAAARLAGDGISQNVAVASCIPRGKWRVALRLPRPSAFAENSAIAACAEAGRWGEALMLLAASPPNIVASAAAVNACGQGGQWLCAIALLARHNHNILAVNAAISALERWGRWLQATSLLVASQEASIQTTVVSFSGLIGAFQQRLSLGEYIKNVMAPCKFDFVYVLPARRKPNGHSVGFVNFIDSQTALEVKHTLEGLSGRSSLNMGARISDVQGRELNLAFFVERCGWDAAFDVGAPQLFAGGRRLTASQVSNVCQELSAPFRHQARKLLQQEKAVSRGPVRAGTEGGADSNSTVVAQRIQEAGVWQVTLDLPKDEEISASEQISSHGRQWQLPVAMFGDMHRRMILASAITYNTLISAFEELSDWQNALILLQLMSRSRTHPTEISYSSVVSACAKALQWQLALSQLEQLNQAEPSTCLVAYTSAILSLSDPSLWEVVLGLLHSLRRLSLQQTSLCSGAALSICEKGAAAAHAPRLLQELLQEVRGLRGLVS
eukprot:s1414_g1.t1